MIPRDVAELLDELDTDVLFITSRPHHVEAKEHVKRLRATLTRAFGERVLECSTCSWRGDDRIEAIEVEGHMECPDCKDRNHLRVRER